MGTLAFRIGLPPALQVGAGAEAGRKTLDINFHPERLAPQFWRRPRSSACAGKRPKAKTVEGPTTGGLQHGAQSGGVPASVRLDVLPRPA